MMIGVLQAEFVHLLAQRGDARIGILGFPGSRC
jgi:hypothetical protein